MIENALTKTPAGGGLATFDEIEKMARVAATSGLFKGITKPESAMALMMLCQSEGLHYMQALRRYHIVDGRPSMRADAMLADFMKRGGTVRWIKRDHAEVSAEFKSKGCPDGVVISWSDKDVQIAGLAKKDNHVNYPRQMKTARVISEGIRVADPEVVVGIYSTEEVQDFDDRPPMPEYPAELPAESQVRLAEQEARNATALSTPRKKREKTAEPTRNWPKSEDAEFAEAVDAKEAAKAEAPKDSTAVPGFSSKPAAATSASPVASATATSVTSAAVSTSPSTSGTASTASSASSGNSAPDAAATSSATRPESAPSSTPERESGSDDGDDSFPTEDNWAGVNHDDPVLPEDLVECFKQKGGNWESAGPERRRTLGQNKRLQELRAMCEIPDDDTQYGWRPRLDRKFNKRTSRDLSEREAAVLIRDLETRVAKGHTPGTKREKWKEQGFVQGKNGQWSDPR